MIKSDLGLREVLRVSIFGTDNFFTFVKGRNRESGHGQPAECMPAAGVFLWQQAVVCVERRPRSRLDFFLRCMAEAGRDPVLVVCCFMQSEHICLKQNSVPGSMTLHGHI